MSTDKTWQLSSKSSGDTEKIGKALGENLRGGETIELVSDLGGGKTTMVRGIAAGAGSSDKVASPTFTISKVYQGKKIRIVHYDFYRLQDPGLLQHELSESIGDPKTVSIIEWADIVQEVLPEDTVSIRIKATGEDTRTITITTSEKLSYLMKGVEQCLF